MRIIDDTKYERVRIYVDEYVSFFWKHQRKKDRLHSFMFVYDHSSLPAWSAFTFQWRERTWSIFLNVKIKSRIFLLQIYSYYKSNLIRSFN